MMRLQQVIVVVVDDNYQYEAWGPALASDLQISRVVGMAETAVNESLAYEWQAHKLSEGGVYAFGTCLLPGTAGGRNGIRYTHLVFLADSSDANMVKDALKFVYGGDIIHCARLVYSQLTDAKPRAVLVGYVEKFSAEIESKFESALTGDGVLPSESVDLAVTEESGHIPETIRAQPSQVWLVVLVCLLIFFAGAAAGGGAVLFIGPNVSKAGGCARGYECVRSSSKPKSASRARE